MQWPTKLFVVGAAIFLVGVFVTLVVGRAPGLVVATFGGCLAALFKFNRPWLRREARLRERA
jgi:hypothetical protein